MEMRNADRHNGAGGGAPRQAHHICPVRHEPAGQRKFFNAMKRRQLVGYCETRNALLIAKGERSSTVNNASGRSFHATSNALSMSSAVQTSRDRTSIANDVAVRQLTKKSPDRESRGSVFCQTDPARRLPFVPASSGPSASYRFMARCRQQSGTALTFQSQRNSARPVRKSVATCSQKMSLHPEFARSRLRTKSQELRGPP